MTIIKELPEHLTNQIAAGEVIERPASVVKELVENAIDAGSTQIDVLVEEAGLRKIKVVDNGAGIHPDEVRLAFERHATSKIYSPEDLFRIHTLGFRGEALPSIASVAKVTLETAQENQPGRFLQIEGGTVKEERPHGARKGTAVTVENLFYNTPARLKYVKTIQTELSSITDILNRISLSHPEIAFRLMHEGNQLIRTSGNGDLKQAVAGVYGTKTARKMLEIKSENLDFSVAGQVSMPEITRASRNYLTVILNGRYIRNYQLQKAILEGYGSRLMIGRYPIAVIHVETDALLLDVNVHPAKREVRISKERELALLITQAVQSAMKDKTFIPDGLENLSFKRKTAFEFRQEQMQVELEEKPSSSQTEEKQEPSVPAYDFFVNEPAFPTHPPDAKKEENTIRKDSSPFSGSAIPLEHREPILEVVERAAEEQPAQRPFPELHYFGQMHGTYLFAQNEKGLYVVDQHAAQERIKYEYYREEIANVSNVLQNLLLPITVDLPLDEYMTVLANQDKLEEIGIFLEPFGQQTFLLSKHPAWFARGQEEAILHDILQMLFQEGSISLQKLREDAAIMMSCKRSIKANHHLNEKEARQLLSDLAQTKNPFNCPHGRPVLIHFSNGDMERMFKRIQDPH